MKITVFQSDKGDCLLLTGADSSTLLADGGMRGSYTDHVAPTLGKMAEDGTALDLVYVSHIDQDHIAGILKMMDDEVDWRVYDYQQTSGNTQFRKPRTPRPPTVRALWHNAFRDQVEGNIGDIEDLLVTSMKSFLLDEAFAEQTEIFSDLVTSIREAILLNHRVSPEQLGISVNEPAEGGLLFVDSGMDVIELGNMTITIIGPFEETLDDLRDDWNEWLEENQEKVRQIREEARRDAERLHADEGAIFVQTMHTLANALGDRDRVTLPNLASLMLLVEEDDRSILLTGDGHAEDILKGLAVTGKLNEHGRIHVDVLKVQHHGSENNIDRGFCERVTADHYLFCGNGAHHNPDLEVVETLIDARLDASDRPFKLWFNSSVNVTKPQYKAHMEKLEKLIARKTNNNRKKMKYRFLKRGSKFEINFR